MKLSNDTEFYNTGEFLFCTFTNHSLNWFITIDTVWK